MLALAAVLDGVGLLMLVPILDVAIHASGAPLQGGGISAPLIRLVDGYGEMTRLSLLLGLFVALMAARSVVQAARDHHISRLQLEFVESIRLDLIERLASAGWQRLIQVSHPRIVQALSGEIHQIGIAANWVVLGAVALTMLVANAFLAAMLSPLAGGLALTFAGLGMLACSPYLRRTRVLGRAVTDANLGLTGSALAFLAGLKLATAQSLEHGFIAEQRVNSAAAMRSRLLFLQFQVRGRNATLALAALVGAATLFVGVGAFHLPASVLLTLLLALSRTTAPALIVQQAAHHIIHSLPAFDAVEDLQRELEMTAPVDELADTGTDVDGPAGAITLSGVCFHHTAEAVGLDAVDLVIPAGAFIGIRGPSGSGKTTLLDLVSGLLVPQSGSISLGGHPLSGATLQRFRERLAYVAQEPFLFDDTIRRNLAWSREGIGEAEMWAALAQVDADRLVRRLTSGLDTRIGERGVMLSAGERQRLALARALLRRPAVLVLDEATNAIDIAGERVILERLASMAGAVTILLAAHRRESLALCDSVIEFPLVRETRASLHDGRMAPSRKGLLA
ncbi:ABC transporter ATP-binding protein [Sphingomonas sp. JC676]|uniref:ATP-binding cassette domain-containing protein n=1 Tax=Sphingomonas sp. JC676 TaxID=2768065 RepID=UPI001657CB8F|nr:ABC transporter ATP-binding protein [Sphingomonas sp. JC676]MBC9035109.1 ABC transporter ATP-binding protein [Sphingomonas sp. JC676]